jgi:hypothetical protein
MNGLCPQCAAKKAPKIPIREMIERAKAEVRKLKGRPPRRNSAE